MKEVMAVIRMNKINPTKRALSAAGISSFTATGRVVGRGKGLVDPKVVEAAQLGVEEALAQLKRGPMLVPKRVLHVVVPDELVETTVDCIMEVNRTGKPGDGKIFVLPIMEAVRVRTGEAGADVLDHVAAAAAKE